MKNLIGEMRQDKQYGKKGEYIVIVPAHVYEAIGTCLPESSYKGFSNDWTGLDLLGNEKVQIFLDHETKTINIYKADTYEEIIRK